MPKFVSGVFYFINLVDLLCIGKAALRQGKILIAHLKCHENHKTVGQCFFLLNTVFTLLTSFSHPRSHRLSYILKSSECGDNWCGENLGVAACGHHLALKSREFEHAISDLHYPVKKKP